MHEEPPELRKACVCLTPPCFPPIHHPFLQPEASQCAASSCPGPCLILLRPTKAREANPGRGNRSKGRKCGNARHVQENSQAPSSRKRGGFGDGGSGRGNQGWLGRGWNVRRWNSGFIPKAKGCWQRYFRKRYDQGTSLMVQWLRLRIPNVGEPGFNPWSGS